MEDIIIRDQSYQRHKNIPTGAKEESTYMVVATGIKVHEDVRLTRVVTVCYNYGIDLLWRMGIEDGSERDPIDVWGFHLRDVPK